MQHLEGSGTPVLYIGSTVLKGLTTLKMTGVLGIQDVSRFSLRSSVLKHVEERG